MRALRWALSLSLSAMMVFVCTASARAAEDKIIIGYLASASWSGAFVALDRGYFKKHGIEAELTLIGVSPSIPPALIAGSIQIGGLTPPEFMQANEQGLELVVVGGATVAPNAPGTGGVVARTGSGLNGVGDLIGRKVAVPGFGAVLDVLTKKWVQSANLDYHRVGWVELPFPRISDAMKTGLVDAATLVNPFFSLITESKIGYIIGDIGSVIPAGTPSTFYVASNKWATENANLTKEFRAALDEATRFMRDPANAGQVKASIAKYTKLPLPVVETQPLPNLQANLNASQLRFWIDLLREQGLIRGNSDPETLIIP